MHKTDPITKKCEQQASNNVLSEYKIRFSVNKLLVNSVPCQSRSEERIRDHPSYLRNSITVNSIFCYSPSFPVQYNLSTRAIAVLFPSNIKKLESFLLQTTLFAFLVSLLSSNLAFMTSLFLEQPYSFWFIIQYSVRLSFTPSVQVFHPLSTILQQSFFLKKKIIHIFFCLPCIVYMVRYKYKWFASI